MRVRGARLKRRQNDCRTVRTAPKTRSYLLNKPFRLLALVQVHHSRQEACPVWFISDNLKELPKLSVNVLPHIRSATVEALGTCNSTGRILFHNYCNWISCLLRPTRETCASSQQQSARYRTKKLYGCSFVWWILCNWCSSAVARQTSPLTVMGCIWGLMEG